MTPPELRNGCRVMTTFFRNHLGYLAAMALALFSGACNDRFNCPTCPSEVSPANNSVAAGQPEAVATAAAEPAKPQFIDIPNLFPDLPFELPKLPLPELPRLPDLPIPIPFPHIPGVPQPGELFPLPPHELPIVGPVPGGTALAAEIRRAEANAKRSCRPIPDFVYRTLRGMFSETTLGVCFSTDWGAAQNWTLQQFLLANDFAGAVTLNRVIVFRSPDLALTETRDTIALWIHELVHVEQYARMGIDNFANRYIVDWQSIENEAEARESQAVWPVGTNPRPIPPVQPVPPVGNPTPIQASTWVRCFTPMGVSNYFLGTPGTPCVMFAPWGPVAGIAR